MGKTKRGKGTKLLVVVDGQGLPIGNHCCTASTHEAKSVEKTLSHVITKRKPEVLVYDRAADSDPLRAKLKQQGIELVCPHRSNRIKKPTQDGSRLRRFKRRWIVERTIAWMQSFRRLITRFEKKLEIFQTFIFLACIKTVRLKSVRTKTVVSVFV